MGRRARSRPSRGESARHALPWRGAPRASAMQESRSGAEAGAGTAGMPEASGSARPGDIPEARGLAPSDAAGGERTLVLHVDIDAFFAAIEQQRDPRLAGQAGDRRRGRDRVVLVRGAPLRAQGRHAAVRGAGGCCPRGRHPRGPRAGLSLLRRATSSTAAATLSPDVETYLDEAYCDLTGTERLHGDRAARRRAAQARRSCDATGLTVTCGIGPNRMLAKLIGKTVKPDGLARDRAPPRPRRS